MPALSNPRAPCCDKHVVHSSFGLNVLYPQNAVAQKTCEIDIVAVHGLGDNPQRAWVRQLDQPNEKGSDHVNWLEDGNMLPSIVPKARIMTFNYEPVVNAVVQGRASTHAGELLAALSRMRHEDNTTRRPVIFVGHAYGGIIIQQAIAAASSPDSEHHHITSTCIGTLLLGTPQTGSTELSLGQCLANSAYLLGFSRKWFDLEQIVSEGEAIRRLALNFARLAEELEIRFTCFYEQVPTAYTRYIKDHVSVPFSGSPFVVPEELACVPGEMKAKLGSDHFRLNKFAGPNDEGFQTVATLISEIVTEAASIVGSRPQSIGDANDDSALGAAHMARLLFATEPWSDANRIFSFRGPILEGTSDWLLETPEGKEWHSSPCSELLWMCGKPGIGKTYTSIRTVKTLQETIDPSNQGVLFALCDSREPERNNAEMILRSFLWQMLQSDRSLMNVLTAHYKQHGSGFMSGFQSLWFLLEVFLKQTARETFCVIDGVNECDPKSQSLLLSYFGSLVEKSHDAQYTFKLLISSRETQPIEQSLSRFTKLSLTGRPELVRDLQTFATAVCKPLQSRFGLNDGITQALSSALHEKADGNFQWMSLARSLLNKVEASEGLNTYVRNMPPGLYKMYRHILSTVNSTNGGALRTLFMWIVGSVRTLTLEELAIAAFSTQDLPSKIERVQELLKPCEPFLVVRRNAVFLLHQSAADFFSKPKSAAQAGPIFDWNVCKPESHDHMAARCLDFVESSVLETAPWEIVGNVDYLTQALKSHPFLEYACRYWPRHARQSESDKSRWLEFSRPMFLTLSPLRELWFMVFWALWEGRETYHPLELVKKTKRPRKQFRSSPPQRLSLLHIACFCKLTSVCAALSNNPTWDRMLNSVDGDGSTPLCFAIQFGTVKLVQFLLSNGADPNKYEAGSPAPVPMAAAHGHLNILRLLLEAGADPNQKGLDNASALMVASSMGYYKIVKLLLEQNSIEVNTRSNTIASPLQLVFDTETTPIEFSKYVQEDGFMPDQDMDAMAAQLRGERLPTPVPDQRDGRRCVMDLLFADARLNLHVWGGLFGTILNTAVAKENLEAVKILVSKGVNLEAVYDFHSTALQTACESGNLAIAEVLLEAGADPNFRESSKLAPLQIAAANNNLDLVRLLLDYQADPDLPRLDRHSMLCKLQQALFNGKASYAMRIHKAMGLDVVENSTCCHYCAQLFARSTVEEMELYIGEESPEIIDPWTPLQFAAGNGNVEIIRELLDAGAAILTTRNHGTTALHLAAAHGREAAVEELIRRGISPHALRSNDGYTPLHCAIESSQMAVTKRLLKITKDIHEANPTGAETPLQLAVSKGNPDIIELFEELDLSDEIIWNDFYQAALLSSALDEVGYFNAFGNKVTAKGGHRVYKQFLEAALLQAAKTGKLKIVCCVMEKGVGVDVRNEHKQTALQLAVANGHEEVVRELLEYGASTNSTMDDGQSVVLTAAAGDNTQILRRILEHDADIHKKTLTGEMALHVAATHGSLDNVKLLIEAGAKVDAIDASRATAMIHAVAHGHDRVGLYLLHQGAKVQPKYDETLLHLAVANGCENIASYILMRQEINVNEANADGNTPLHYASHTDRPAAVKLLIDEGANVNALNCDNATPLYIAAGAGNIEVVHILLESGANVHSKANGGMSPLYVASGGGHVEVVALLLEYGANVNCKTSSRKTPLHVAKYLEVWELLIGNGADKSARDLKLRKPPKANDYSPVMTTADHELDLDFEMPKLITPFAK